MRLALRCLQLLICVLLGACSSRAPQTDDPKSSLLSMSARHKPKVSVSAMRVQILRDTALSVGARAGLAQRARQINRMLLKHEVVLARIFNFHAMLLENQILPPVLVEARQAASFSSNDSIRIAEMNYKILHQAKFVSTAPHWRDYLWMSYRNPDTPDKTLLPNNREEKVVWQKYVEEGWLAGILQAESIFRENIHRLERDYNGMIRYRKLLASNMVSPPYVTSVDMGITGDKDNITVHDRVLKITAFPGLEVDSSKWKAEIKQYE
jgi:defect-in-organelle-trafficking protein DotC